MARRSRILLVAAMLIGSASPAFADKVDQLLEKSRAAERLGHRAEAFGLAQSAIVADPARASSYTALGDLYLRQDQSEFARFYFQEALAIDPQERGATDGIARAEAAEKSGPAAAARSLDNPEGPH
jgi:tetratricopeptide (TPR) repeat protein